MRRIRTNILHTSVIAVFVCIFAACKAELDRPGHESLPVEVGLFAGGRVTRTQILSDGLSVAWSDDDILSVWAKDNSGVYTLENQPFRTYGLDYERGFFTSTLASAMPDGTYTYYATCPQPQSVSGTLASFVLPSEQDGSAKGLDIMFAVPVEHAALTAVPQIEDHSGMSMEMNHLLHFFRFYLPEGEQSLGGESIERIVASFPVDICGTVTADFSAEQPVASLDGGGRVVTMNLADEIVPAGGYAYLPFVPFAAEDGQSIRLKVYTETKIGLTDAIPLNSRTFAAGHSTPVKIIPVDVQNRCKLYFTIADNNLGEPVRTVTLTAPEGCRFGDGGGNTYVYENADGFDAGESFYVEYEVEGDYRTLSEADLSVRYESEHAVVNGTAMVPSLASGYNASVRLDVPYLYSEDFASCGSDSSYGDKNYVAATNAGSNTAVDLAASYGWPDGWTGARCGLRAYSDIRLCCRSEKAVGIPGNYYGRLDSPAMTNLKSGADGVSLRIQFDYSFGRNGSKSNFIQHFLAVGTHQTRGKINSVSGLGSPFVGGAKRGTSLSSDQLIAVDVNVAAETTDNGTWIAPKYHFDEVAAQACTDANRLVFECYVNNDSGDGYYNYWVFIDNIRVSIQI